MIKAVVVDDERLVRKGFISLIDWSSFGVLIVGEAGEGAAALELLEQQEVDLLFVDITMPGMSGFDLIRMVRQRFPAIRCVVLTCHHEFDYVQEALRLGAVDYIVKTLLEVENADETIRRLVERMKWEDHTREAMGRGEDKRMTADKALLYLPLDSGRSEEELFRLSVVKNNPLIAFEKMWMTPLLTRIREEEGRRECRTVLGSHWRTVLLCGLRDVPFQELERECSGKLEQMLFYSARTDDMAVIDYEKMKRMAAARQALPADKDVLILAEDLRWTIDGTEWDCFIAGIVREEPYYERIPAFGSALLQEWSQLLLKPEEAAQLEAAMAHNLTWSHWKQWLRRFSDHVGRRMLELNLTKEVMSCLIRAVRYMRNHAGEKINQGDVAAVISMSRGYFSQCFAKFAGETFGESLRNMRLELAKALLLETSEPIGEIAYKSGFEDDRYFSRLFREHVGMLPSEFRTEGLLKRES